MHERRGGGRWAVAGGSGVKGGVTVGALHARLDLGPMLIVVGQRRQRHLGLAWLAVAQEQQALGRDALGQHLAAQGGGGQRREPRMQRGEDGFAGAGHEE